SALNAHLNWQPGDESQGVLDRASGQLSMRGLNLGQLLGPVIPEALLTLTMDFQAGLHNASVPHDVALDLRIDEGSRWNKQPVQGTFSLAAFGLADIAKALMQPGNSPETPGEQDALVALGAAPVVEGAQATTGTPDLQSTQPGVAQNDAGITAADPLSSRLQTLLPGLAAVRVGELNMDMVLGSNRLKGSGAWGQPESRLSLDIAAPALAHFWPELPGGVSVQGQLGGALSNHLLDLKTRYTPANSRPDRLGQAPIDLTLRAQGGLGVSSAGADSTSVPGWQGSVQAFQVVHDEITVRSLAPVSVSWREVAGRQQPQWQVGAARLEVQLSKMRRPLLVLDHQASEGGPGRWSTRGQIESLRVSPWRVNRIRQLLDIAAQQADQEGGVVVLGEEGNDRWAVNLGVNWNLSFAGALQGDVRLRRISGDVMVPAEPDF
ncbi:MAG: hypothetical protein B7X56_06950, partial [Burkholderiales bacterium 34-67-9]